MSARTPFRSHLLQQWASNNGRRPPVAVVPWLHNSSNGHNNNNNNTTTNNDAFGPTGTTTTTTTAGPTSTVITKSTPMNNLDSNHSFSTILSSSMAVNPTTTMKKKTTTTMMTTVVVDTPETSVQRIPSTLPMRNPLTSSPSSSSSSSSPNLNGASVLGIDNNTYGDAKVDIAYFQRRNGRNISSNNNNSSSSLHRSIIDASRCMNHHQQQQQQRAAFSSAASSRSESINSTSSNNLQMSRYGDDGDDYDDDDDDESVDGYHQTDTDSQGETIIEERDTKYSRIGYVDDDNTTTTTTTTTTGLMQSLLMSRRTATRLEFTTHKPPHNDDVNGAIAASASHRTERLQQQHDLQREEEERMILDILHRAVLAGQMAPNHKRTEPFSFIRFASSSQAAQRLADIAYHVTLRKANSSEPVARTKRNKWSNIPAFLVTLVHENQSRADDDDDDLDATTIGNDLDDDPFETLQHMPPLTERQLEDYAAACAAIQNVLLSLHADGVASKWATGPVIRTRAFRRLIHAQPTDRVAALIMVGGLDSTHFTSSREEQLTNIRRYRRRRVVGDLLTDLP